MNSNMELPIPSYVRWQCRRGMLELDILLLSYFDKKYEHLPIVQQKAFVALLSHSDQQLYAWLIGTETPPIPSTQNLVQSILADKWKE